MRFFEAIHDGDLHKAEQWPSDMPKDAAKKLEAAIKQLEAEMPTAFSQQADAIIAQLKEGDPTAPIDVPRLRAKTENLLREQLTQAALVGGAVAAAEIPTIVFDLPHRAAQEWAAQHAAELVSQIDDVTRQVLRDEIAQAMKQTGGVRYADLKARIRSVLTTGGEYRARRIALTEPVKAYHAGSTQAYEASGVVWGRGWVAGQAGACKVCQALNGKVAKLGQPFVVVVDGKTFTVQQGDLAHPNDRCRIRPVTFAEARRKGLVDANNNDQPQGAS